MQNKMNIHPLFPQHVVSFDLDLDNLKILNFLKNLKYKSTLEKNKKVQNLTSETLSEISLSINLFDSYTLLDDLKKTIIECINLYTNEIFSIDYNFKFTTSWGTRTIKNCFSQNHHHKNSFISGVYYPYLNDNTIMFSDRSVDKRTSFEIEKPIKYNLYNSSTWTFSFKQNTLVLFPSYLDHAIIENKNEEDRYSLAFNTVPIGKFGIEDSAIHLT